MKLSFIINAYDRPNYLENTLKTIKRQIRDDMEIIVVVDKTGTNMQELAEQYGAQYYETTYRCGDIGTSQNVGAKMAIGEYLCLLDQDCIFHHDAVEKILYHISDKSDVRLLVEWCGPGVEFPDTKEKLDKFYFEDSIQRPRYGYVTHMPWGSVQILKREFFIQVGGFDERFRGYSETQRDFAARVGIGGWEKKSFYIDQIVSEQFHPPREWQKEFQEIPEFKEHLDRLVNERYDVAAMNGVEYSKGNLVVNQGVEWGVPAQL